MTAGRDCTVRFWKVEEESHLIYRAGGGSGLVNVVACLDKYHFFTGYDDRSLILWTIENR